MQRKHPLYVIAMNCPKLYPNQPTIEEEADISGRLCVCSDKLSWDGYIESAEIEDIVVFTQSGAYGLSMGMVNFMDHPYPKEVFVPNELDCGVNSK